MELTIAEMKEKSIIYCFKIFNKETAVLLAHGYVIIVATDKHIGKAMKISKEIVEKLKAFCRYVL